jgi:hypothetical protein
MKKFKRFLRLFLLLLMIAMASVSPVPILFYGKDHLPKNLTELFEDVTKDDEEDDMKELF